MTETYRIHFGYSKRSRYYAQAIELSRLASGYEVIGEGDNAWHIVTVTDDQIDLLTALYKVAVKVPLRKSPDPSVRFQDMDRIRVKLEHESRIDYIDPGTQGWVRTQNKPGEPVADYRYIRELIAAGNFAEAITSYYATLGSRYYGEFTNELIYLKRFAGVPLAGRDLLYFLSESARNGIIESNLAGYVACIDESLAALRLQGRKTPLEVILEHAPTMEQMIQRRADDWHLGVYLWNGEFKRDNTPITLHSFSTAFDACPEGRLFDRYPNQVQHCRISTFSTEPKYTGLWVTYSPDFYKSEILDKGLHLNGIEAYRHKAWREYRGKWRQEPSFQTVQLLDDIEKSDYGTNGVEYTGRTHTIAGTVFFEINLIRQMDGTETTENPFIELVDEILREAENALRGKLGLPRIGEGWISETQLFRLVQQFFPDAQQHASPDWLRPQHLDVFVPSQMLGFEYQGKQHFEPVDFFGGDLSFQSTVKRDKIKANKCKANGLALIIWLYTEPIDRKTLETKLAAISLRI